MRLTNPSTADNSMLRSFFVDELRDIYWAEKHLVKALPKMEKKSTTNGLAQAFATHGEETKWHVERLEEIFDLLNEKAKTKKCEAMSGIIEEAQTIIADTKSDTMTRDVGLIFAGQKAEHYEIATYGGLITIAKTLGYNDVAEVLKQTLSEEKSADEKLTEIAESYVNQEATTEEE